MKRRRSVDFRFFMPSYDASEPFLAYSKMNI